MAEIVSVACVGFLVEGTGACVLVGGSGSFPSSGQGRVQWCILECLSTLYDFRQFPANGQGCVHILLVVWHGDASTGACWLLGGAGSSC